MSDPCDAGQDYDDLRDKIVELFNPPDADASEFGILVTALDQAHALIIALPCGCSMTDPCPRCETLGRFQDEPVAW